MLSDIIKDFCKYYRTINDQPFKYDEFTNNFTEELTTILQYELALPEDEYFIKGSVGQGAWAEIPWIAIMHRGVTESTQSGYYVVILFSKDLRKIYISLGLGWTQFSEIFGNKVAKKNAQIRASMLKDKLSIESEDITGKLDLEATTPRGKGYEVCNITERKLFIRELNNEILIYTLSN